jgi:tetratricopeptide (TPR) repeat protein
MALRQWGNKFITLCLAFVSLQAVGQSNTDAQLAAQYYRSGEFDKAAIYYERLYDLRPTEEHYHYYLGCLLALEDWREAERLVEKQIKQHAGTLRYQVDLGTVYAHSGDLTKAEKAFDHAIKDAGKASITQVLDLGKAFSEINEDDRALEVYYNARKQMGSSYPFNFQIAQVLGQKEDVEGMVNEYLDVLEISGGYLQSVQNTLNRVIGFEEENKYNHILEEQLMLRVQRDPDAEVYAQMLIWMLVKQDRFDAALVQVIALDKRNRESGDRVMTLAHQALNSFQYNVAIQAFQYVKEKGSQSVNFEDASIGLLKARNAKITGSNFSQLDMEQLCQTYAATIAEFQHKSSVWEIMVDYAHVMAFYQSKFDQSAIASSINILKEAMGLPGLNDEQLAHIKITLGDVYVLSGNIWDASLLFGQVEKRFKYDEIGFEAKLRNAKVFYYSGDFGWCEAQLDVLKGSTSKLISNDALELSIFISENTGLDSTTEALEVFAHAEMMMAQHKYDSALFLLDLIEQQFPGHELSDNLIYQRANIALEEGRHEEAVAYYLAVQSQYPSGILADNALMEAGRILEQALHKQTEAMDAFQLILTDYPGSLFVVEARKRFRKLRGDLIP